MSKSRISLSEEAMELLNDCVAPFKRKCKNAWNNAFAKFKALTSSDSNEESNSILKDVGDSGLDTNVLDDDDEREKETEEREKKIIESQKQKNKKKTVDHRKEKDDVETNPDDLTGEDIDETMKETSNVDSLDKVFRVSNMEDNMLWEPYMDAKEKECVRISSVHRFSKQVYEYNAKNKALQVFFDLLLYVQAKSEFDVMKNYHEYKSEEIEKILTEFRMAVSEKLTKLCRKEDGKLPQDKES